MPGVMSTDSNHEGVVSPPTKQHLAFNAWRRALGNFALLKHRRVDGYLVSMHQSGTHWLKFMLANALSAHYGVAPPRYNHANDIIGGPRDTRLHHHLPHLVSSHSMPHPLMYTPVLKQLWRLPPYVLLVRDMRAALVSNFEKWSERYGVSFSTYLRGEPFSHRYNSDIWWQIRFLNAWYKLMQARPGLVVLARYEDLQVNPAPMLKTISDHCKLNLDDDAIAKGIAASGKEAMAAKHDPARPPGAVRQSHTHPFDYFSAADRHMFTAWCQRYLDHHFDYNYSDWSV